MKYRSLYSGFLDCKDESGKNTIIHVERDGIYEMKPIFLESKRMVIDLGNSFKPSIGMVIFKRFFQPLSDSPDLFTGTPFIIDRYGEYVYPGDKINVEGHHVFPAIKGEAVVNYDPVNGKMIFTLVKNRNLVGVEKKNDFTGIISFTKIKK